MIETIFTFTLMFVLNTASVPGCLGPVAEADACYFYETQTIYVQEETQRPQDFVLYHEIGHHIFKSYFDQTLFSDREIMADQFALFIYAQKYPYNGKTGAKDYPFKSMMTDARYDYFKQHCDALCQDGILSIKLPNSHWDKPFLLRA